jgi:hypothetical protein
VTVGLVLGAGAAYAEPPLPSPVQRLVPTDPDRIRLGAALHWLPKALGRRLGLGVGWTLPQRWDDADGQLLTERALLVPGDDLERSGFYLALRF